MNYRYLVFGGLMVWGKNELTKEYFVAAAQRGDLVIDLQEGTYFDKDENAWVPVEGDK